LTKNSRVGQKPYVHLVDEIEKVDIDYPDDLVIAEAFLKKYLEHESK
jgi:CMP-N-acetylneuraminic acid synthetase